ncbi:hypothetical protein [Luteitalea sp.]
MTAMMTAVHLTPRRAEQYRRLGTDVVLAKFEGERQMAEARIELEEAAELLAARTAAERHGVRQFFQWVRQAHVVRQ